MAVSGLCLEEVSWPSTVTLIGLVFTLLKFFPCGGIYERKPNVRSFGFPFAINQVRSDLVTRKPPGFQVVIPFCGPLKRGNLHTTPALGDRETFSSDSDNFFLASRKFIFILVLAGRSYFQSTYLSHNCCSDAGAADGNDECVKVWRSK